MTRRLPSIAPTLTKPQEPAAWGRLQNLGWLIRYARRCRLAYPELYEDTDPLPRIRAKFSAGAWRLLCRSSKRDFLPILRNRELMFLSLVNYCERLVERSFVSAPPAVLLHFFVSQRRLYFNLPCRIPEGEDYDLIRVASRSPILKTSDIASVANWSSQAGIVISSRNSWRALVNRAKKFWEHEQLSLTNYEREPWHFFCRGTDWRGYRIEPLAIPSQLWLEGRHQGNCLYKLRFDCSSLKLSRFFSIMREGRRVATLELSWRPPDRSDCGMNLVLGAWEVQDLRKSYNRLPDDAMLTSMKAFAWQYNLWAKRPGRMPAGGLAAHLKESRRRIRQLNGRDHWPIW